jgi:hypothetical protein
MRIFVILTVNITSIKISYLLKKTILTWFDSKIRYLNNPTTIGAANGVSYNYNNRKDNKKDSTVSEFK